MKTSKQILDEACLISIPLHGDYQLYRFDTISKGPRINEEWMTADEFRDAAVKARRQAAALLECADSMDNWLVGHCHVTG
jgi:hypothetical protein